MGGFFVHSSWNAKSHFMSQSLHNTWRGLKYCAKCCYLFTLFSGNALSWILLTKNCHSTLYSATAPGSSWSIKILLSQLLSWKLSSAITWPLHSSKHVSTSPLCSTGASVVLRVLSYLPCQCVQVLRQQNPIMFLSCRKGNLCSFWTHSEACYKSQCSEHVVKLWPSLWWL